jgi:hypothetical protein
MIRKKIGEGEIIMIRDDGKQCGWHRFGYFLGAYPNTNAEFDSYFEFTGMIFSLPMQ